MVWSGDQLCREGTIGELLYAACCMHAPLSGLDLHKASSDIPLHVGPSRATSYSPLVLLPQVSLGGDIVRLPLPSKPDVHGSGHYLCDVRYSFRLS